MTRPSLSVANNTETASPALSQNVVPEVTTTVQPLLSPKQLSDIKQQIKDVKKLENYEAIAEDRDLNSDEKKKIAELEAAVAEREKILPDAFQAKGGPKKNSKDLESTLATFDDNAKKASASMVKDYEEQFGKERRFNAHVILGKKWDDNYAKPEVGDRGESYLKFPDSEKAVDFYQKQAAKNPDKAFIVSDKHGNVTAYSNGIDGKLHKPDGGEYNKGDVLSAGGKPQKLNDFTMPHPENDPILDDATTRTPD